jgi:hypothetical protein
MDDGCQVMAKAHIAFGKVSLKKMLSGIYATSVTWLWTMGKATMNK